MSRPTSIPGRLSHPNTTSPLQAKASRSSLPSGILPRGSALLYVIAAIALLGALGGGVAYFSSSSSTSQLARTRSDQAYFAALAGQEYVKARHEYYEANPDNVAKSQVFADFIADLETNGGVYVLDASNRFTITVTILSAVEPYRYKATVVGSYLDSQDATPENFTIDDAGATGSGGSGVEFDPVSPDEDDDDELSPGKMNRKTPVVTNASTIDGGVYGDSVTLNNQSTVTEDVISLSFVVVGNQVAVGGDVCAATYVLLENQSTVKGDINAQTYVTLGNNTVVEGSVYAGGNVTLQNGAKVLGDVHSGGNVTLGSNSATVSGSVYATGDVTVNNAAKVANNVHAGDDITVNWGGTIGGNALAGGTVTVNYGGTVGGTKSSNTASPPRVTPTAPSACGTVETPPLQTFTAGTTNISVGWDADKDIAPGTYGSLSTGGQNVITLHGGTYTFSSMSLAWNCVWRLDLSGDDITIFCVGNVVFGGYVTILVSTDGVNYLSMWDVDQNLAAKVYLETHGSFTSNEQGRWFGTVLAKNNITFSGGEDSTGNAKVIGALSTVDGTITLSNKFSNIYVESNFAKANW
ncbi:polymer-forming cytoskeletal protein [Desulfolutivibrio sulfoxidireducens]|uniref:polymer-forming cytoskeletal protein n=1 Tax=Desulfolutivibrio sulfoxidireducens TaxID=2773299 RepID=UPI00159E8501|nr:polymer-forming cytoskeletal protein [Desulfolutivibrio sulfoxidireducens]QLA19373.1 UDP-3-O-(3-hydroxymyristoyl)glucosamine N-acyltransferase [Desulfolutivibrio sulfoxidireducens]